MEIVIIMEGVKIIVSIFLEWDGEMAYPNWDKKDIKKLKVQNHNLHEELGGVDHLFCDKTGTLTQNELKFKQWACDGLLGDDLPMGNDRFINFLRCITLNNDVMVVFHEGKRKLSGSSLDEINLIEMVEARRLAKIVAKDSE